MPIHYPPDAPYRIVSCDPGTDTLGVALSELDLKLGILTVQEAHTFRGSQLQRHYPVVSRYHNDRFARLLGHEDNLFNYFNQTAPHLIVSEGPYLGRFPAAFAALTEVVSTIRRAAIRYDPYLKFLVIDPSTVKKAIGMRGNSGDKSIVKQTLLAAIHNRIGTLQSHVDLNSLDEHAIDAIAVGWVSSKLINEELR